MLITITAASILAITALTWLVKKILPTGVCPVCAGVFLTWVGLLGAYNFGYQIDLAVPALLMGGTVVGIAYQLEKKIVNSSVEKLLLFKALFMSAGFVAAYGIMEQLWTEFVIAVAFLSLLSFAFLRPSSTGTNQRTEKSDDLEEEMKSCC